MDLCSNYLQTNGWKSFSGKKFETDEGEECFIEQNIKKFDCDDYLPTGHVCKNYIKVS